MIGYVSKPQPNIRFSEYIKPYVPLCALHHSQLRCLNYKLININVRFKEFVTHQFFNEDKMIPLQLMLQLIQEFLVIESKHTLTVIHFHLFQINIIYIGGSKGGARDARPPLGVQILSFSCSFRQIFEK